MTEPSASIRVGAFKCFSINYHAPPDLTIMHHRIHFGSEHGFDAAVDEPLLIAGLKAGYALPYECGTGTCGTCHTSIREGTVIDPWPNAPGLSFGKRAKNGVLLCQAVATSDCRLPDALSKKREEFLPPVRSFEGKANATNETDDVARISVALDKPITFLPGQYALFKLPGVAGYRAYSMANSATTQTSLLHFYIRRVGGGSASPILTSAIDLPVQLVAPLGNAFLDSGSKRNLLCVAGGTGLAPLLSIATGALELGMLREQRVDLFIGVRTPSDIFANAVLQRLVVASAGAVQVNWCISGDGQFADWKGERGMVHEVVARVIEDLPERQVYMGGPQPMIDAMLRMLLKSRVKRSQIRFDKFS